MFEIGTAADRSGVSIEAIRYYEREGIIPKPARAANGRRVYTMAEIARLRLLKTCRELGFSLPDAKSMVEMSEAAHSDCQAVYRMSEKQLAQTRHRIAELQKLEAALNELMENCSAGRTDCPMLAELGKS